MNPTAFTLFGLDIKWYAIIATASMILGTVYTLRQGEKEDFKSDDILDIAIFTFPIGIICARLYYVIFNWSYYSSDWIEIFNIRGGGLAFHGGLIGGLIAVYFVVNKHKMNFWKLGDILAVAVPISQALGRWANFVNQEAHGGPTTLPWGIMIDGVKVHPTFLYESIWNLIVYATLINIRKSKKFDGQLIGWYLILYSVGRFFVEGLRTDSLYIFETFRTAQVISVMMIVAGIILLRVMRNYGTRPAYKLEEIEEEV